MKKSSKIILIIVSILIIVAVGVGVGLLVKSSNKKIAVLENEIAELKEKNENKTNNTNVVESTSNETDKANVAIKAAMKDEEWLKNNVFNENNEVYYEQYGTDWYESAKQQLYFAKLHNIDNEPAYIITQTLPDACKAAVIVTYNNGSVKVINVPIFYNCFVQADFNTNIIKIIGDAEGDVDLYKIENGELVKFAYTQYNGIDEYCYVGDECVSSDKFETYTKGDFNDITTKLTDSNIDLYVK